MSAAAGHQQVQKRPGHQSATNTSSAAPSSSSVSITVHDNEVPEKSKEGPTPSNRDSSLPLAQSAALAFTYMMGSIIFFLLIRYSKAKEKNGELMYDNAAAVFFTELCKCVFSVGAMFYRTGKFLPISVFREGTWKIGIYYAVPSGIYALYNNLTYSNLTLFDPGTYQVFMQTRVLFTGLLYTWILSKTLTNRKWGSLVLLTIGVAAKYFTFNMQIDHRVLFMLFQASLSAFAGVYNEFLLKKDINMDVNEQNFFMYSFALFFNLSWGMMNNSEYYLSGQVFEHLNSILLVIIIVGATVGIVTSLILKFINVIVKAFASACEVLLTAIFAAALLGEPLTGQDVVACMIVMGSIYVYYSHGMGDGTTTTTATTTSTTAGTTTGISSSPHVGTSIATGSNKEDR